MTWFVYIIKASNHAYYTGITTDIERRFKEHAGGKLGAKYFNGKKPLSVVYQEGEHTRSSASKREAEIKKLTHSQKESLVNSQAS